MPLSPMMQRYIVLKEKYKDCLVFYRLGDFYEMFFDDALTASKELQLTLTGRDCGLEEKAPMCGVPYHSVNNYINKLLEKNYKVAICEQLTDPKESKGLVERDVIRVITPGTVIEDAMLEGKNNNFLAAAVWRENRCGIAWADVSTGEFNLTEVFCENGLDAVCDKLFEISPNEIIVDAGFAQAAQRMPEYIRKQFKPFMEVSGLFESEADITKLVRRFREAKGFEKKYPCAVQAAAGLWSYLGTTQKNTLAHMTQLSFIAGKEYLQLDAAAIRNLEIFKSMGGHGTRGTLLWLLDKTETAMGGRKLKAWLERPLRKKEEIDRRLDAVEELAQNYILREDLKPQLGTIGDIERICTRVSYGTVNARETSAMRRSLKVLPEIRQALLGCQSALLKECGENIDGLEDICGLLEAAIAEDPADSVKEGGIIRDGYNAQLDAYRDAVKNGQNWILQLEAKEREETGIKTLKIKFNKVFGYSIEVTNSFLDKVPYTYVRKQTLTGGERFITPELKAMEEKILGSEEKAIRLEYEIFCQVREELLKALPRLKQTAYAISTADCLCALAAVAAEFSYTRPTIQTDGAIRITQGRHPVIEAMMNDCSFVPNDTLLDTEENRFMVITGPNMAGKSTYMRQVALITLMAHIGSFVPAAQAEISVCDRIFTRVGASDDLAAGQSTFMLEMNEVAGILKNATRDSLIILDEIGRGTSTFDGLSIAWAVTEYIAKKKNIGAKTLFATHYHELSELEGRLDGIKNYCITVKEHGEDVIFLRKIMRGSADKSFGIAVAHLAGLPKPVLERAKEILATLEEADISKSGVVLTGGKAKPAKAEQTLMFVSSNTQDIIQKLKAVDINTLTPISALNILCELREQAKRENE